MRADGNLNERWRWALFGPRRDGKTMHVRHMHDALQGAGELQVNWLMSFSDIGLSVLSIECKKVLRYPGKVSKPLGQPFVRYK
jgi:hypothetical protein